MAAKPDKISHAIDCLVAQYLEVLVQAVDIAKDYRNRSEWNMHAE